MTNAIAQLENIDGSPVEELTVMNLWKIDKSLVDVNRVGDYSAKFKDLHGNPYTRHTEALIVQELLTKSSDTYRLPHMK